MLHSHSSGLWEASLAQPWVVFLHSPRSSTPVPFPRTASSANTPTFFPTSSLPSVLFLPSFRAYSSWRRHLFVRNQTRMEASPMATTPMRGVVSFHSSLTRFQVVPGALLLAQCASLVVPSLA